MTVAQQIAAWAAGAASFSPLAVARARAAVTDTIGCILAGRDDPATRAVAQAFATAGQQAGGQGCAAVSGQRVGVGVAALVNGTAAHALDFDDNFHGATTHASAVLVPALLAAAQAHGRSGAEVIEAYIVGLEAQAWVGRGVNPSHYTAGWHSTSTVGCIGAAAAVARLLGLGQSSIAAAMTIAVSLCGGPKGQFGTPVKPFHAGLAARNAVEAALLASSGMSARADILEARDGFLGLCGGDYARGWPEPESGPGEGMLAIETIGLTAKRHPCCGATHRAIDAVLDLRRDHGFGAEDVAAIRVQVTQAHANNLSYARPANEMQARFSMPYALALALRQDALCLIDFTLPAVEREEVRALLPLTELTVYDPSEERAASGRLPHRVTVFLKNGDRLLDIRQSARGDASLPFSEAERWRKFADCTDFGGVFPGQAEALFAWLGAFSSHDREAIAGFSFPSRGVA
ncbi:MmgE/PrpD family protein [Azospirillum sp.]|uniref:MmgE/PrpD family protein n=1 Tax=Azospirillum sp. TaxID=34012 RepID=UPI00261B9DCA|nr:MmgE/PrpD family protein [Azospirillum sp.]